MNPIPYFFPLLLPRGDIFSDQAIDDIYRFSSGAARLINKLCTHCLLYGSQNGHRIIDDRMVKRDRGGIVVNRPGLKDYFIKTGFYDLLPMALKLAGNQGYDHFEMIEAICKVHDKFNQYPPTKNRTAWFKLFLKRS